MTFYPKKISEKFHAPKNTGVAKDANAVGTNATFVCGAVLRFTLRIDFETKKILEAKFKNNGCGYLIAAAELLAEKIVGKHLTELHGLDRQFLEFETEREANDSSNDRDHCFELALKALQSALADFRHTRIEEWTGEKALVCTCFSVSEETIEKVVKEKWLETVEEVTDACRAGGGCGSCQPLIQDIIEVIRSEEI